MTDNTSTNCAKSVVGCLAYLLIAFASVQPGQASGQPSTEWAIHDMDRPQPEVVDVGASGIALRFAQPPSDAIELFGTKSSGLELWRSGENDPCKWQVGDGYFVAVPGSGGITTTESFGDAQIHIEWASPDPAEGEGQDNGNSGLFIMGRYEVQILNSFESQTYPDGQAGAVYGQHPPLVNASRGPGEWQTYDIVFHRPRFAADGSVESPARVTVLHNGVLVQDNVTLTGPTSHKTRAPYVAHADRLPISLQDHGHPVRFRNVWVRNLE